MLLECDKVLDLLNKALEFAADIKQRLAIFLTHSIKDKYILKNNDLDKSLKVKEDVKTKQIDF